MTAETQIIELKLELPPAPKPVGVYKPIVIAGNLAYVSGHGPLKPDKTLITGRVGADLDFRRACIVVRMWRFLRYTANLLSIAGLGIPLLSQLL